MSYALGGHGVAATGSENEAMESTPTDHATELAGAPGPAIVVDQISKQFDDNVALDHVSLSIESGTVYGLLGPNGAGKTTLIRVLTTLLEPTSGHAYVAGAEVSADPRRVRSRIGLAGQFAAVDEHLSGRENLQMVGQLYNLSGKEARLRADAVLRRIHLDDAADQLVRTYSGGMRRRLDLAASMVGRPAVLFLDEPTTGVDPRSRLDIWELIEELVGDGTTLLLTTQYLDEAERLANRIGVIDKGHLIAEGTATELKDQLGGDRVEMTLPGTDFSAGLGALSNFDGLLQSNEQLGTVTVPAPDGTKDLLAVVRQLDAVGITPVDIGLRRPSLDDVFLALTDHDRTKEVVA